jgi:glutamate-5-semialdehyde dehydrogenase
MVDALLEVIALPDPVGGTDYETLRPNGLRVGRRRIPLGVIGMIYEARPNVTSDAAALCLKSGNVVVLKGGKRALRTNRAVVAALHEGLATSNIPTAAVQFVDSGDRDSIKELLQKDEFVDLIIPRGGEGLIRYVAEHSRIPVIKHYKGVCHVYLDRLADPEKAIPIVVNSKVQRPSVCNAAETLLVHRDVLDGLFVEVARVLVDAGVTLHLDEKALDACRRHGVGDAVRCVVATDEDFHAEYLSLDLAVAVVADVEGAIEHIQRYGSDHTESIITEDIGASTRFVDAIQSSVVAVNASTRFADGNQLGLGAEIGVSTTKLHAFGPMGLRELTTTKFVVVGQGHIRT